MRRALVVGGSEGIGLALGLELERRGYVVTIASRDPIKLSAARRAFPEGATPEILALDVTAGDGVSAVLGDWVRGGGPPDMLVVCPGFTVAGPFAAIGVDRHREMMELNYFGHLNVLLALVPSMAARGEGRIVTLSSALGLMGAFGFSGYCASKFAIVGLSEALASELAPVGIKVSCVCPPAVDTPGFQREWATKSDAVRRMEVSTGLLESRRVAREIVRDVERGRFMILPGRRWAAAAAASRLFPALRRRLTRAGPDFWVFNHGAT